MALVPMVAPADCNPAMMNMALVPMVAPADCNPAMTNMALVPMVAPADCNPAMMNMALVPMVAPADCNPAMTNMALVPMAAPVVPPPHIGVYGALSPMDIDNNPAATRLVPDHTAAAAADNWVVSHSTLPDTSVVPHLHNDVH
jgi:hypothetical protein